jgi:predicted RNase H-like nuclease (RuvC/YqgF family)
MGIFKGRVGAPSPTAEGVDRDSEGSGPDLEPIREWLGSLEGSHQALSGRVQEHQRALDTLSTLPHRIDELTLAVAEGIKHVERAERRVRTTIQRARAELAEHGMESAGLEAEWEELRDQDADRSGEGRMQLVREEVEEDPGGLIEVPDWLPGDWSRADLEALGGG